VDGGVRNIDEIEEFGSPVFSKSLISTSRKDRVKVLFIDKVIKVDGVRVRVGDILLGMEPELPLNLSRRLRR
jgi:regulator of RNase E activity RraA